MNPSAQVDGGLKIGKLFCQFRSRLLVLKCYLP